MKKLLLSMVLLASCISQTSAKEIDVNTSKGTEQSVITSLTPTAANMDVDQDVVLKAVFNVELDVASVQKNNVKLKKITPTKESMIDGQVAYDATENAVTFTPSTLLTNGYYEVEFKSLKPTKAYKDQQIEEIKYRFYVPEVINGYKVPPEPDEALNNATLLGADVNDNGVRDDVERKIIITYQKPIEIELMMSYAKIHQSMINDPATLAIETEKKMSRVIDCRMYLKHQGIRVDSIVDFTESNMYNTKQRVKAYLEFNKALSGGVYGTSPSNWNADACDFDVEQMLKDRQ